MPVTTTSRVMGAPDEADLAALAAHLFAQALGERHGLEAQFRVAERLAAGDDLRLGARVAGSFVLHARRDVEHGAGPDERAEARLVDGHEERHVGEIAEAEER